MRILPNKFSNFKEFFKDFFLLFRPKSRILTIIEPFSAFWKSTQASNPFLQKMAFLAQFQRFNILILHKLQLINNLNTASPLS
ncbi:hypothetical protein B7988_14355 [Fibrobacter sp. UWB1]|nr:hypothetical protein B7988_14355 [Fibrobacter sp. UWB1]